MAGRNARITVTSGERGGFSVHVEDDVSSRDFDVVVPEDFIEAHGVSAERLIEESFRFLLEREPKESILQSFALGVIETYFPEYRAELQRRLRP